MNTKNIYFYSTTTTYTSSGHNNSDSQLYVNTVPMYLNAYLKNKRFDLYTAVNWAKIQLLPITKEQLINDLITYDIDILCLSVYVWNQEHIFEIIKDLKKQIKKQITIVAGGPSIAPHRDKEFFKHNPDIDYAVYAQGESAFVSILDNLINAQPITRLNAKNIAWNDHKTNTIKVADYEFIRDKNFSPYIDSEELIKKITDTYPNRVYYLPYETSKGCPYNCTFCDWTSGLSHKVTHRQVSIDDELMLFAKYRLTNLHMSDANFGQHKQDIELSEKMAKYRTEKNIPFRMPNSNFSKLKKKEVFYIAELFIKSGIMDSPKFAFEDIHDEVLTNIDRPCIPWEEHFNYIKELKNKFPDLVYRVEMIIGLPGQTRQSWEETLCAFPGFQVESYPWILLPNSPAGYDLDYKSKMGIKTQLLRPWYGNQDSNDNLVPLVTETYSYNFDDYIYNITISHLLKHKCFINADRRMVIDRINASDKFNDMLTAMKQYMHVKITRQDLMKVYYNLVDDLFERYTDWPNEIIIMHRALTDKI